MTNEVKTNNPNHNYYIGVGRRKNASATVYLKTDGTGKIEIAKRGKKNQRSLEEYFTNSLLYKKEIVKLWSQVPFMWENSSTIFSP